jgi:tellurite resistance protein TerC
MVPNVAEWWMWAGVFALVGALVFVDLFLLGGRSAHRVTLREAAGWSAFWIALALAFNGALWWYLDRTAGSAVADAKALEFLTGFLIEKSLAVDNIFVWLMLFAHFAVPAELQRRVLLYGVLGAIVMRTGMIMAGAWLIAQFHWVLYLFGLFLVVTGIKMLVAANVRPDFERNPVLKWLRRRVRLTPDYDGERFFVVRGGLRHATPLFLVLVLVEVTDLVFAVDSIPAIFAITSDPFIVVTSNVFAILGLRALYFLLKDAADRFHYLKYGLALVLVFVGTKMLVVDFLKIPVWWSLGSIATIIAVSIVSSRLVPPRRDVAEKARS